MLRLDALLTGLVCLALATGLGCATGAAAGRGWRHQQPQLYPNDYYRHVGHETARWDVADCMSEADYGATHHSVAEDAVLNTLGGAAAGAALGAIGGAIAGNPGTGAAAGAAVGGALGAGKTVYDTRKPQPGYKGWVEACLRDRGYEVISWR